MSPASVEFSIVDVFSTTPYKGNPLAIVDDLAGILTDTQLRLITRQFNLSETTFFFKPTKADATFRLRSFLPDGKEVFGAGHNILGVWWFLANDGRLDLSRPESVNQSSGVETFMFYQELGSEVTPVRVFRKKTGDAPATYSISLRQASPQSHAYHPDADGLANSIGLRGQDIGIRSLNECGQKETTLRPQVMSTSTTRHLIVPLSSIEALDEAVVQRDRLLEQLAAVDRSAYGIYLFTPVKHAENTSTKTYRARFFSPGMSSEDPATGSAAGPLSAYLYRHGQLHLATGATEIEVLQGQKLGRDCVIQVALSSSEAGLSVDLVGSGAQVANGQLVVPNSSTTF